MRGALPALLLTALPLLGGCAALGSVAASEQAQLDWTGPGAGPCLFGGVTPRAEQHCSEIAFGVEGQLEAVNEKVRAGLGNDRNCLDHVEALKVALAARHDLRADSVYSCPLAYRGRGECHVSLLVTTPRGQRYVLDNGAVVNPMIGAQGVTDFASYGKAVQGVYWIGLPPTADDVVAAFGSGARPLLRSAR